MGKTSPDPWRIPAIGPWVGRVGSVAAIMSLNCSPTPEMWVQSFFVSVPKLIWSLFKPDAFDQVTERLHFGHRRKRRFGTAISGILEPLKWTGRGWGAALFFLGALAERIGWWFCIVDAATELAVNWSTTAMQYAGCIPVELGPCQADCHHDLGTPGGTGYVLMWPDYDPSGWTAFNGVKVPPGVEFQIGGSVAVAPWDLYPNINGFAVCELHDMDSGEVLMRFGSMDTRKTPGTYQRSHMRTMSARGHWRKFGIHYEVYGGYVQFDGSKISVSATTNIAQSILSDP